MNQTGDFLSVSARALIRGIDIRYLNQKVITINLIYFGIIYIYKSLLDKEQAQWIKARFNGYFLSE